MKFLDLFAGIGGFRLGMERAGHECVGYVEWDKFARKSYETIHNTEGEWTTHDITKVEREEIESIGEVDVICGGFPCQPFSQAGLKRGYQDTRGTLFFDVARFAYILKPKYLLLENVKGLLNHAKGETFRIILDTLESLGYDVEWQLLNSKDFGVPQNRERLFIIGHLRGATTRKVFPVQAESRSFIKSHGTSQGKREWVFPTVYTKAHRGDATYVVDSGRIRLLTAKESWKLQGFSEEQYNLAESAGISESQLYKQAGNSVTVNVIKAIAERLNLS